MSQKKSGLITLLLCLFLGFLGIHRFYVGRVGSGVAMLLTAGGLGLWWMVDIVLVVTNEFKDADGNVVTFTRKGDGAKRYLLGIVAMFLPPMIFFTAVVVSVALLFTDGLSDTIKQQLTAIREGHYKAAYEFTSKGFRNETSFETFEQFVENYPIMKHNAGISINERQVDQNDGYIQGVIYSKEGGELPIEYQLIYEDGHWRIVGFRVSPLDSGEEAEAEEDGNSGEGYDETKTADTTNVKDLTYKSSIGKYSIEYPSSWYYETPDEHSVLFSGKKGSPAYISTVTIQSLPMKKVGGIYANAKEVVKDLKQQINEQANDVKIVREGEAELPTDSKNYRGNFFEVTYTYKGVKMKKMQFIIVNPASTQAYSWGYTTEVSRYDKDLPIAQAMYESWKMNASEPVKATQSQSEQTKKSTTN